MPITVWDNEAGKEVQVNESELASGYQAGRYRVQEGQAIPVMDPYGAVGTIDASRAAEAFGAGYEVVPDAVYQDARNRAIYGDTGSQIAAGAEGVARGLSLGFYDAAANAIDPEYAREAQLRAEINPTTAVAGEIGGALLPILLSGGSGAAVEGGSLGARGAALAARGARAATALPRAASALGRAAGSGAERLVGTEAGSLLGRVAQKAIVTGVEGAAESLPYAIGHGVSEASLHPEKTSEQILAGIGLETLMGGLAGGVLGGGAKLGSESYQRIARAVFGEGTHPRLGEAIVKGMSALSGDSADDISRIAMGDAGEGFFSASARKNRQLAFHEGQGVRDRVARDLTESLDDARAALSNIQENYMGLSKIDAVDKLLPKETRQAQIIANRNYLKVVDEALEKMAGSKGTVFKSQLKDLRDVVKAQRGRLEASIRGRGATAAGPEATGYAALDEVKRRLQGAIEASTASLQRSPKVKVQAYGKQTIDHLEGLQEQIRQHLMNEDLFGMAAVAQREVNDPWMRMIAANKNLSQRARLFQQFKAGEVAEYGNQWRADPEQITRYLDSITDPKKDLVHSDLKQWLDQGEKFSAAVGKYGSKGEFADETLGAAVKKYQDAVGRIRGGLGEVEDAIVLQNQAKALSTSGIFEGSDLGLGAGLSYVADSVVPFAASGVVGGLKGAANALSAPGKTLRQLAAIERLASGVSSKMDGGVTKYINAVKKAAQTGSYVSKKAAVRGAGVASRRKDTKESNRKAYERTKARLEAAKADPEGVRERLARSTRNIAADAPQITEALHARAIKANDFLESKLPKTPEASSPWRKPTLLDSELAKYAKYVRATEDPVGTLSKELDDGTLSRETMETLDALYPEMAQDVRTSVTEQLASMKDPPPYPERVRLSILLGTPLDDSLNPAKVAIYQNSYTMPEPPKPRPMGGSAMESISKNYETTLNRLSV